MELNVTLKHRLDVAFFQIIDFEPDQRRDLQHMWRNAKNLWNLMDQEMIQCRRLHKPTPKYTEFEQQLIEALETIEKYITFGLLTK
jgi:hemerythrin superfamily protein